MLLQSQIYVIYSLQFFFIYSAENKFPEKLHHDEDEPVQVFDDEVPPTMIRKVAPAPSAPAYKG